MSRYIKKHPWQITGIALPVFLSFLLVFIGLQILPGWIQPLYGVPGAICTGANDTVCNVCNRETCNTITILPFVCVDANGNSTGPDSQTPACPQNMQPPFAVNFPECYTACQEVPTTFFFPPELPQCLPDNSLCDGLNDNACRTAECIPGLTTFDFQNPTGCDYEFDPGLDANCVDCQQSPPPAPFDNCGNGICEPEIGEDCQNCDVDCLLPGFADTCPLTSGSTINAACMFNITFDGPPYNVPNGGQCEDGDLCTDDQCQLVIGGGFQCVPSDKSCSNDFFDFCCAPGCHPPVAGVPCGSDPACDLDCLEPILCPTPSPTPTPTPSVLPVNTLRIFGDGCSLNQTGEASSGSPGLLLTGLIVALGTAIILRNRSSSEDRN